MTESEECGVVVEWECGSWVESGNKSCSGAAIELTNQVVSQLVSQLAIQHTNQPTEWSCGQLGPGGHVVMWLCGHVVMWSCGYVVMWSA